MCTKKSRLFKRWLWGKDWISQPNPENEDVEPKKPRRR